jgi:hypothetical protein
MKKSLLLCFLCFICLETFSQVKLGLRFAPGVSFPRASEDPQQEDSVGNKGGGFGFFGGPEINFILGDNYTFTTGLWYSVKRVGIQIPNRSFDERSNVQYVQLPVTMKLYTNDIAPDMKLYFQLGGTADIKVSEKVKTRQLTILANEDKNFNRFKPYDFTVLLGAGVQLQMGSNTYVFGGISYNRGLTNILTKKYVNEIIEDTAPNGKDLSYKPKLKTNLISLDLGIRF